MNILKWYKSVKLKRWIFKDTVSVGQVDHWHRLLADISPSFTSSLLGAHFLFANQHNDTIGMDGYDNYQAPVIDDNQRLKRRMWVKGAIEFFKPLTLGSCLQCIENVQSVRVIRDSVFVNIMRHFSTNDQEVILRESRYLMYTNSTFRTKDHADDQILTTSDANANKCLRLTLTDLSIKKYSFLTYNLHKIHLDRNYCQTEGLGEVIAQAPLLITLALNFFHRQHPNKTIDKIDYKIAYPIYANLPITLELIDNNVLIRDNTNRVCFSSLLAVQETEPQKRF